MEEYNAKQAVEPKKETQINAELCELNDALSGLEKSTHNLLGQIEPIRSPRDMPCKDPEGEAQVSLCLLAEKIRELRYKARQIDEAVKTASYEVEL